MGKTKKIIKRLALLGIPLIFILFGGIIAITSVFVAIAGGGSSAKEANIESSMVGLPSIITSDMVIGSIEAHEKYGVYASVTLAQIILESGGDYPGNLSALAYECHNLFGMKGEGPAGSKTYKTKEYNSDGSSYYVEAKFRKYNNFKESIDDHGRLLSQGRYKEETATATSADEFAKAIARAGYATDPGYADTLISIMKKYDLYRFDEMDVAGFKEWLEGDGKVTGDYMWPLSIKGTITSYFGNRDIPTAGATANHGAIDIAAPSGTAVYAADGGTVIHAGSYGTGGNAVIISHGNNEETHYYHLRAGDGIMVKKGQKVSKGQQIGRVGTTGASTGFHLHFGIKKGDKFVDPLLYVKQPK